MNKNYPAVTDHLKNHIGENFTGKVEAFRTEFRSELLSWFQTTYKEILNIKKGDEFRNKRVVDTLNKNISDLKQIVDYYEKKEWADQWIDMVDELTEELPETVVEYQTEERFQPDEDDSVILKTLKSIKRALRTLSVPFKRDKKGWKQVIQLRKSVRLQLNVLSDLPDELLSDEYQILTDAVAKLLEKEPVKQSEKSESKTEETVEGVEPDTKSEGSTDRVGLKFQVIEQIEVHLQDAISLLKDVNVDEELTSRVIDETFEFSVRSGTVEENRKRLEKDNYDTELVRKNSTLSGSQKGWITYLRSQYSDFAIQIEIARFAYLSENAKEEILNYTHTFFRDYCYLPLETGISKIKEIAATLREQKSGQLPAKLIKDLREKVEVDLNEKLMGVMAQEEGQKHLIYQIQKTITDLQLGFYNFTDTFVLAESRSVVEGKPKVTTDTVNWKKLASRYVKENALREMDPEKRQWQSFLKEITEETKEAIQIVDVNLMTAKESEKDKDEDQSVLEIAIGGTERSVNQLEMMIKTVRERQNEYENVVKVLFPQAIQKLADTMLSRSYTELEMQDKALQVKAKAYNWQERGRRVYYTVLDRAEVFRRFITLKFKEGRKVIARYLGFESEGSISTTEKRNLAEYLAKVDEHVNFPFVYKRLFNFEFDIDERFYIAPKGLYLHFKQSFEDWNFNIDTNLLITGERGSGKSLALKFIKDKFLKDQKITTVHFDKTIRTEKELIKILCDAFGFEEIDDRDEFIKKIQSKRSRSILVVENIQNTFVRNIHGFGAIESLWVIMTSTRNKLYWMVTCSAFAWSYFEKVYGSNQYFSHISRSDRLDREAIENAILARHKATGYELKFEPGPATQKSRAFKKIISSDTDAQEFLKKQYFDRLDKIAEGNLSIAMIFWMQSIKEFDDKYVTQLPTEVADLDKLEVPSRDVLFTLSALVLHQNLNVEELSIALHQDISVSRLMLSRLKSKGIVQETDNGFILNQLVYRQVVRLLRRRNIIH